MSARADLMRLVRQYRKEGWQIEPTGGHHLKWVPPTGAAIFFTSSTPGDWRNLANVKAQIKRALQPIPMRYSINQN